MQIVIIAPGSRGDVQPYIALGKGLQEAGHSIRLVSHKNFKSLVESYGLAFWSVDSDVRNIVENRAMRERIEKGNFVSLMAQMAKQAQQEAFRFTEAGLAAAQGMDLVLAGMGGFYIGMSIAEKLNLPLLQAYVVPFTPTKELPSVLAPNLPAVFNRLSHHLTRQFMWLGFRSADALVRRKVLGIPPAPLFGLYNSKPVRDMPVLYGFSPSVIPAPSDWNQNIHITGYWFADEPDDWQPPAALLNFLNSGSPPVYIGFGSMSNRDPEATAGLIFQALAQVSQRGVVLSGWDGLRQERVPDSIFMINSVPHAWLFPRVAAVVHHGGASTTAAGLRSGVPSIVIPYMGDQAFWGQRIADLGAGPAPIPRRKLTAGRLADAIREVITNQELRKRAYELGKQIQSENGLASAVEIVSQLDIRKPV